MILLFALSYLIANNQLGKAQVSAVGHVTSVQVAATVAPVLIASGGRALIGAEAFSTGTSTTWVKVYNAASATGVTCGQASPLPAARYYIPGNANGFGFITAQAPADIYPQGIVACFTTGFADTDTTAPAASTFVVNFHWQ